MPDYIIQQGDTLARIAEQFELRNWKRIYDHPSNAGFRKKHPNPNLRYPGETVFVPERELRAEDAASDKRSTFRVEHHPLVLRIAAEDMDLNRLAGVSYLLEIDGERRTGTTDSNGILQEKIPPLAASARLQIGDYTWILGIGHLNPAGADVALGGAVLDVFPEPVVTKGSGIILNFVVGVVYLVGQLGEFFSRPGSEEEFLIGNYYLRP